MTKTLIVGARCIDPAAGLDEVRNVLIDSGRVAAVTAPSERPGADEVWDASGLVVAPSFIDLHVHLRVPGGEAAETVESGMRAAAAGGFTTVYCMPNTSPVIDSPITVKYVIDRAAEAKSGQVVPIAAATRGQNGEELTDFAALREAGAGALSDDGRPVSNPEIMRRAMEHAACLGMVIFDHCEDMPLTGEGVMHEGAVSVRLGLKGIPRASEAACVARDCLLSLMTGCRLHVCHVSNRDSVDAIRHFKRRGAPVTAEVSPHHLTLTDEAVARNGGYDTHAKMKPPLCDESDRQALIEALEDGTIDCIATDHAPHSPASKATTFDAAPFGIIGLETAFSVLHTAFVKPGRWTIGFLIDKMACAPGRVMEGTTPGPLVGSLKAGGAANLCILHPGHGFTFGAEHIRSRSRNSPWVGQAMNGAVAGTMFGGAWTMHNATLIRLANPGTA